MKISRESSDRPANNEDGIATIDHQRHHQWRHQATLGVVHVEFVAQVGLGLLATIAVNVALGHKALFGTAEMLHEIFDNDARFGEHQWLCLAAALNGDDRRLAQGVDFLQFRGRQSVAAALERFQMIRNLQLLEEPEDAL